MINCLKEGGVYRMFIVLVLRLYMCRRTANPTVYNQCKIRHLIYTQ